MRQIGANLWQAQAQATLASDLATQAFHRAHAESRPRLQHLVMLCPRDLLSSAACRSVAGC